MDLLTINRGAVVAPAGCGKTQSIVDAVGRSDGKPVLVLTHTNAGVCALRTRMARARIATARHRVATLDGWALQVVLAYPELAGLRPDLSAISYPALRDATLRAIISGALDAIIRATYGRVIVDEYQDCNDVQHRLVLELADRLPCTILGDPLQSIFDFAGPMPDWDGEVLALFPLAAELDRPYRWLNVGEGAFGEWIQSIRPGLLAGRGLDLSLAPANVRWIDMTGPKSQVPAEFEAMAGLHLGDGQHGLVIGDSRNRASRAAFARRHSRVDVMEPVDMPDLLPMIGPLAAATGADRAIKTLTLATSVMTGIDQPFLDRLGRVATGADVAASGVEHALVAALSTPTFAAVANLLERLRGDPATRTFRPDLLNATIQGARRASDSPGDLRRAVLEIKEAKRSEGRALPRLGIGSTLLLKGLEADHGLILDATTLNARHLYVAISRASRSIAVLSDRNIIGSA